MNFISNLLLSSSLLTALSHGQVQGLWRTKTQNMSDLCKVAKELKDQFASFEIRHVERVS